MGEKDSSAAYICVPCKHQLQRHRPLTWSHNTVTYIFTLGVSFQLIVRDSGNAFGDDYIGKVFAPHTGARALLRGEFPETLRVQREVALAGLPSRRLDGLLVCSASRLAVVSQSNVKSRRRKSASSDVGSKRDSSFSMYLRPVLLMETFLYWRLFHYYFNLISEACCHAKFMYDTHISGFFRRHR